MKLTRIIYILSLIILLGCKNDPSLDGNYSICHSGEYMEVYFKKDSMRVASDNEWVKLSEWRKIEIKNDTLHFETFGEWRDSWKVQIEYVGTNKIKLNILESGNSLNLNRVNGKLSFEKPKEFWNGFYNRQNSKNCKKEKTSATSINESE